jgi:hypothetical protein
VESTLAEVRKQLALSHLRRRWQLMMLHRNPREVLQDAAWGVHENSILGSVDIHLHQIHIIGVCDLQHVGERLGIHRNARHLFQGSGPSVTRV